MALDIENYTMTSLETAVLDHDIIEFQTLINEISWSNRPSLDFIRAIRMALELEAPLIARKLAEQGAEYHPANPELSKMARILAPPEVFTDIRLPRLDIKANKLWIDAHRKEYKGKWVALHNGELIASENTFSELKNEVGNIKGKGILITQVT